MIKEMLKREKGISMISLVITIIIIVILTNILIYDAKDRLYVEKLTDLYNDIEILREKVEEYYEKYGRLPAQTKYTETNQLSSVLSVKNDTGDFYVIDLESMQGITLNYGKDYEKIKVDSENADNYTDVYIINEHSHNIFYVKGIKIEENGVVNVYYTDYTEPDETIVDLRFVDGILIPEGYCCIGTVTDSSGNESIVISNVQGEEIDTSKTNQYTWIKQISKIEKKPSSVTLDSNQEEYQFIESVNTYKGYFKNIEGKVQYVVVDEEWSEAYTKEIEYEDINGDKVTIPQGFKISMAPTMNTVENGFVVKDSEDNEWVWIEVPESVFTTAEDNADYDNIKADLIEYAKDYRHGSSIQDYNWDDEWYAIDGDTLITANTEGLTSDQKELKNGCGLTFDKYQEHYQKMLSSVYTNRGFWISRYEIGDSTSTTSNTTRTTTTGITEKAVSQANQIPYNYVTCSQAQTLASGMSLDSDKTSSLLFGIQWDLVCKFLEEKSSLTKTDINSDSTNWGNYKNNSLKLSGGKYNINVTNSSSVWTEYTIDTTNYVTDKQTSSNTSYFQLLTTGASEQTRILNIYDFAGNEWEWTLEYTTNSSSPCVNRGGWCGDDGSIDSASFRGGRGTSEGWASNGFRTTLY